MDVAITTAVDAVPDEAELRALRDWLMQENPRPGPVSMTQAPLAGDEMGAATDTLQVALGAGGAITVLAGSVSTWIQTRRQNVKLVLKRADGAELSIDARVKDPEATIETFLKAASEA
jgi:hypothetical protein